MKAAKPRIAIPLILLRFKISLDNLFGSKWLVNELFHLGFSIFYSICDQEFRGYDIIKNTRRKQFHSFCNIAILTRSDIFHGIALFTGTTNKNNHRIKRVAPRRTSTPMKSERIDCRERSLNKIF